MHLRPPIALSLAAVLATGAHPASAGALQVTPVGFELPPGAAAAVLTVRNGDPTPMNVQVRVFTWRQVDGRDQLTPTDDVAVSPPIAPIGPASEHIVRVVRLIAASATEASYRLIVDELPPPPGLGPQRVQLLLRHSIPLFFEAPGATPPKLAWTVAAGDHALTLTGANTGGRHARISNLKLLDAAGKIVAQHAGLVGYVLAGQAANWTLPTDTPAGARPVRLTADGDGGPIDVPLPPGA